MSAEPGEPAAERRLGYLRRGVRLQALPVENELAHVRAPQPEITLEASHLSGALGEALPDTVQIVEEPSESDPGHARVSGIVRIAVVVRPVEGGRRDVRHVRLPVVDPGEEGI